MNTTGSSKWIRFSDYEIIPSDDGTKYVRPVPGSTAAFYDPMLKPGDIAVKILNAADKHMADRDNEKIILDLVRLVGLPGFAMDSSDDYVFPFGGEPAPAGDLRLTRRGEEYGCVFSVGYAEKYDDICAWLETLDASLIEDADYTNLKSIVAHIIFTLTEAEQLRTCDTCGEWFCSDDPEKKTCSKACDFQALLKDRDACIAKGYYNHMFSRPRIKSQLDDDEDSEAAEGESEDGEAEGAEAGEEVAEAVEEAAEE